MARLPATLRGFGLSGFLVALGGLVLAGAIVAGILYGLRTTDRLEHTLWETWATQAATNDQGLTLANLLTRKDKEGARQLLGELGRGFENGDKHALLTRLRSLRLERLGDPEDGAEEDLEFASWPDSSEEPAASDPAEYTRRAVPLRDGEDGPIVGQLWIEYRFGHSAHPIERWKGQAQRFAIGFILVPVLLSTALIALGLVLGLQRARARARLEQLRGQQLLIDFGNQMCHELRNALYVFDNEVGNVHLIVDKVEKLLACWNEALESAGARLRLEPADVERLKGLVRKTLQRERLDPERDLPETCRHATVAFDHLKRFSSYIRLTVEELDRAFVGGERELTLQRVSARAAWTQARELLSVRLHNAGAEVREEPGAGDDHFLGDPRALLHIFINLVKNAVDAFEGVDERRELVFRTSVTAGQVECSVWNSGPAIAPEHLPRIFEKGFTTRKGSGRGTGLALVRQLVQRMNGTIEVASGEGKWTVFRLRFPAAAAPKES
jgi:signal transduction histidine kinase